MKVCIATHSIDIKDGGPSRSVPILARGLSELGIEVTLLTLESPNMNVGLVKNSNVVLKVLPSGHYRSELGNEIKQGGYDIIHSQNLWTPFYHWVAIAARKQGIPYIMTPRGTLEPWSLNQKRLKKQLALRIYQRKDLNKAAAVLATADMEAQSIRNISVTSPIAIIPNGIDLTEYPCRTLESFNNTKKHILFLSRIHKKKGIELLIDSWINLKDKFPDWKIIIAGNGDSDYITELNEKIRENGMDCKVEVIPPVFGQDKVSLYQQSSLFVLPTYSENFGMVIAEAMACGLPVVTTNGTPWSILGKLGMWYIEPNIESLTGAISEALQQGEECLFEKGRKGSVFVRDNYDYMKVARQNLQLYNWIIAKTQLPEFVHTR